VKKWIETLKKVATTAGDNVGFLLGALAAVAAVLVAAFVAEALIRKAHAKKASDGETPVSRESFKLHRMTLIAMLTAGAMVLMYFEFPVPGIPPFYEMDFSEIPIIIGAFAMGPVAGVIMEFLKILLNLLFTGTSTVFVGEFANFIMGCCFVVPASILYYAKKTKVMSRIGLGIGCFMVTVCSCLLNAFVLLPTYSKLFHMDMSTLVAMGTEKNSMISSLGTFIIFGVAPFNLIKYGLVSLVTILVYKRISRLLKKQQ